MKSIVMVGAGKQQVPAVKRLKKWGYEVIATDTHIDAPGALIADYHIHAPAGDIEYISEWIMSHKKELNIKGIFTLINQAYHTALIADLCGLPGLDPEIVFKADNKITMKKRFFESDLPTPKMEIISGWDDLQNKISMFEYPFMLKAPDAFGGRGVIEVEKDDDLFHFWKIISDVSSSKEFLIEEKIEGIFIDIQGFIEEGTLIRGGDCDSYFTDYIEGVGRINPVETLNIAPSQVGKDILDEVYVLLQQCARALDITWGPIGGDFVFSDRGLMAIEVTPRLHGPNGTLWIYNLATGIDPFHYLIHTVCGEKPNRELLTPKKDEIGICKVFLGKPGRPKKIVIPNNKYIVHKNIYACIGKDYNTHGKYYSGAAALFLNTPDLKTARKNLKKIEKRFIYDI